VLDEVTPCLSNIREFLRSFGPSRKRPTLVLEDRWKKTNRPVILMLKNEESAKGLLCQFNFPSFLS